MLWKAMLCALIFALIGLTGCASTKTVTLRGGQTLEAKTIEETSSTYIIEETDTGRRTVVPKGAVVSIK